MADTEQGDAVNCVQNLTITEEVNGSLNGDRSSLEADEAVETYKYGFSLPKYYKLCLKYYHKEKQIIKLTYDDKLMLTAFWKQISCGKFDSSKYPDVGYFDVIGNDRKRAWDNLGEMSVDESMERFCLLLEQCSPEVQPWMEAQQKHAEEQEFLRKEEERKRKEAEEAAERERQRLAAEEEERRRAEEERLRQEEINRRNEEELMQEHNHQLLQQQQQQQQQQHQQHQHKHQVQQSTPQLTTLPMNGGAPRIAPASLWTRPKVQEFIQHVKTDPSSVLVVGRGETMTVRVPTHEGGTCLFWEFATDYCDLGFGVSFEWTQPQSKKITVAVNESDEDEFAEDDDKSGDGENKVPSPPRPRVDEILPVVRRPCNDEVIVGSHMYPGSGVYLLKFDNSYSLFRSKTLCYRVYYTR